MRNMLDDIFEDPIEIVRYLQYNMVAVKVEGYRDWQLMICKLPRFDYIPVSSIYFNSLVNMKQSLIDNETIFKGRFSFTLYNDVNPTEAYSQIWINKYDSFDKSKYTVINLSQIVDLSRPKIVVKLPRTANEREVSK